MFEESVKERRVRNYLNSRITRAKQSDPEANEIVTRYALSDLGFLWVAKRRKADVWYDTIRDIMQMEVGFSAVLEKARNHHGTAAEVVAEYVQFADTYHWIEARLIKLGVRIEDAGICREEVADRVREKIHRLRNPKAFDGWLCRVVGSTAKKYRRKRNPELELEPAHYPVEYVARPCKDTLAEVWSRLSQASRTTLDAYRVRGRVKDIERDFAIARVTARRRFRAALIELGTLLDPVDAGLVWVDSRSGQPCKYIDIVDASYDVEIALRNRSKLLFNSLAYVEVDGVRIAAITLKLPGKCSTQVPAIPNWIGSVGEHTFTIRLFIEGKQVRVSTTRVHIGTRATADTTRLQCAAPVVEKTIFYGATGAVQNPTVGLLKR
jgi:hypothetical protein